MNIINWDFFRAHLLLNLYLLIPQLLIILKEIIKVHVENYAYQEPEDLETENDRTLRKIYRAKKIWFEKRLFYKLNSDAVDCFFLYKLFWLVAAVADTLSIFSFLAMLVMYPVERSTVKKFIEKDYAFYSSLEHPTAKQCREAEDKNSSFLSSADGTCCLKIDHELIDTKALWAKFYLDVKDEAIFLQEAGNK